MSTSSTDTSKTASRRRPHISHGYSQNAGLNKLPPTLNLPASLAGIPNYLGYRIGPGADLADADLNGGDLSWVNLKSTIFRGANLQGIRLWGARLMDADLSAADLRDADLTGCDLVGADLSNARLDGACFVGARYSPTTRFPKSFGSPSARGMVSHDHNLEYALTS